MGGVVRLPAHLLRHTVTVEPYLGEAGTGPRYGPPVTVPCHLEPMRSASRRGDDRGRGDGTLCLAQLDQAPLFVPDARVTAAGRTVEVRSVRERTYPGTPAPEHVEIVLA